MTDIDSTLRDLILRLVPEDGKSIGNKTLLERLALAADFTVTEEEYRRVRDELIDEGILTAGKGRGGSVLRIGPVQTAAPDFTALGLTMPERPEAKRPLTAKPVRKESGPRKKSGEGGQVISYRHQDKRKNNPHVGMVDTASDGVESHTTWAYDPHLDPALQFDVGRARIEKLIDDALASGDQAVMQQALEQLKRLQAPYLNWSGKAERTNHLNLKLRYLYRGASRNFIPDYLIRFTNGKTLVLEVKGQDSEQNKAKRAAMQTWIEAINEQGGFGKWCFEVVLEPSRIRDMVMAHAEDTSPEIKLKHT